MSDVLIPGDDLEGTARTVARETIYSLDVVTFALKRLVHAGATLQTAAEFVVGMSSSGLSLLETVETMLEAAVWRVERHSGRDAEEWRTIYQGDEKGARGRYQALKAALRQGGLRLYHGPVRIAGVWAPRLRTRW